MKKLLIFFVFSLLVVGSVSAYSSPAKENIFFRMNDTDTSITDSSGNGNTGTAYNGLNYGITGVSNSSGEWDTQKAIAFDTTETAGDTSTVDYIQVGNREITTSNAYTMCGWVKIPDTAGAGDFKNKLAKYDVISDGSEDGWGVFINSAGTVMLATDGDNTLTEAQNQGTPVDDNTWHHICGTFDMPDNEVRVYVDGELDYTVTSYTDDSSGTMPLNIGWDGGASTGLDGGIDEFRAIQGEISSTELSNLYNYNQWTALEQDNTAPNLTVDYAPAEGTSVQTPFRVNITATDNKGIDRVVYSADNFTTSKNYRTSEGDLVIQDLAGDIDGTNEIKIKAVDTFGNENITTLSYSEIGFIAFGEGHFHTEYNEFDPSITNDELFSQIRDEDKLDWIAPTEHAQLMSDTEWSSLKSTLNNYNEPGNFTTFLGFEHTEGYRDDTTDETSHGQTHFIYRDYDSGTAKYGSGNYHITEVFDNLNSNANYPYFASSQHQVNNQPWPGKSGWNYTVMNDLLSAYPEFRQVEIFQRRGSALAEWQGFNDNNGLISTYKNYSAGGDYGFIYNETGYERSFPGWGIYALGMDWTGGQVGIMGTSDSHMADSAAIPGSCEIDDNHGIMVYGGGTTGVYTDSLNRTSVWDAMNATDTYSTQCKRASVKVSVDGSLNPKNVSPGSHNVNVVASPLDGDEITSITLWDDMNRTHEQAGLVEHKEYGGKKYVNASFTVSGDNGDIYMARITYNGSSGTTDNSETQWNTWTKPVYVEGEDTTPPSITIDSPQNQTYSSSEVDLNVTSTEPGNESQWIYNLDDQGNVTFTPNTTLENLSSGSHDLTVWAEFTDGNTSSDSVSFTVDIPPENEKSLVDACPSEPFCHESENPKTLNGSFTEEDGNKTFTWTVNATGAAGDYTFFSFFNSTVSRIAEVFTETTTISITEPEQNETNSAPSADFTVSLTDLTADVDASSSTDSDGTITDYEWDWTNDGTYESTGVTASHTYPSNGTYTIKLRVTDDDDATSTLTKTVEVTESTDDGGNGGGDPGDGDNETTVEVDGSSATLLAPHSGARYSKDTFTINEGDSQTELINAGEVTFEVENIESTNTAEILVDGSQSEWSEEETREIRGTDVTLVDVAQKGSEGTVSFTLNEPIDINEPVSWFAYNYTINESGSIELQVREAGLDNTWNTIDSNTVSSTVDNQYVNLTENLEAGIYEARLRLNASGNSSISNVNGFYSGEVPGIEITEPNENEVVEAPRTLKKGIDLSYRFEYRDNSNVTSLGQFFREDSTGNIYSEMPDPDVVTVSEDDNFLESLADVFGFTFEEAYGKAFSWLLPRQPDTYIVDSEMKVEGGFGDYTGYVNATVNDTSGNEKTVYSYGRNIELVPQSSTDYIEDNSDSEVISVGERTFNTSYSVDQDGDGTPEDVTVGTLVTSLDTPEDNSTVVLENLSESSADFHFFAMNVNGTALMNKTMVLKSGNETVHTQRLTPGKNEYRIDVNGSQVNGWKETNYTYEVEYFEPGTDNVSIYNSSQDDEINRFEVQKEENLLTALEKLYKALKDGLDMFVSGLADEVGVTQEKMQHILGAIIVILAAYGSMTKLEFMNPKLVIYQSLGLAFILGVFKWMPQEIGIVIGILAVLKAGGWIAKQVVGNG